MSSKQFSNPKRWGLIFALLFAPLLAGAASRAQAVEIAITLDDLPYVMPSRMTPQQGLEQVQAINKALDVHDITATGFVIGRQIKRTSRPAIEAFVAAGHRLGNHSWAHKDYSAQPLAAFKRSLNRTDRALAPWLNAEGGLKFYRFAYLREGATQQALSEGRAALRAAGYINAPVSIDNDEWRFNAAYMDALDAGDSDAAAQIAKDYLAHMKERSTYYRKRARQSFGRDIKHILLLHMNQINADHLDALLQWYAQEGWEFIALEAALTDPIYAAPDSYVGAKGLSKIDRLLAP